MRRAAWIAFALACALPSAGCNGPNFDSSFTVGSCAIIGGTAQLPGGIQAADCSQAHNYIVIAVEGPSQTCPPGTDTVITGMSPGPRCFRADPSPRPTP
jgi:hypothetical protein